MTEAFLLSRIDVAHHRWLDGTWQWIRAWKVPRASLQRTVASEVSARGGACFSLREGARMFGNMGEREVNMGEWEGVCVFLLKGVLVFRC